MKERLSSYTSRAEFERHVRLVFSNAMEYNNEGDEIWSAAQAMSDFFDSLWRASAGGSTAPEGGADDSEAQMGRAPTVRKPGRRKSAPQQAAQPSPRGDVRGNESPPPSEERGRGREQSRGGAGAPRDYTKAVREGGWKAGALEVRGSSVPRTRPSLGADSVSARASFWRLQVMHLLTEHEHAWPFMGAGSGAAGRKLGLVGIVERLQVERLVI